MVNGHQPSHLGGLAGVPSDSFVGSGGSKQAQNAAGISAGRKRRGRSIVNEE